LNIGGLSILRGTRESSSLLGGVLKGETRRSLNGAEGFVVKFESGTFGIGPMFCGLAGILGLSARFTGGGTGDLGRARLIGFGSAPNSVASAGLAS